jgi:general stress protein YciG
MLRHSLRCGGKCQRIFYTKLLKYCRADSYQRPTQQENEMPNSNQNAHQSHPVTTDGRSKSTSNSGNFKNNPQKAAEAGRKGGKARGKNQS